MTMTNATDTTRPTKTERAIAQHLATAGRKLARGKLHEAKAHIDAAWKLQSARRDQHSVDRHRRATKLLNAFRELLRAHPDYVSYRLSQVAWREELIAERDDRVPDALAKALVDAHCAGVSARRALDAMRDRAVLDGYDDRSLKNAMQLAFELGFNNEGDAG